MVDPTVPETTKGRLRLANATHTTASVFTCDNASALFADDNHWLKDFALRIAMRSV